MKSIVIGLLSSSLYVLAAPPTVVATVVPVPALTAEQQKALTPQAVLDELMAGNVRFTTNHRQVSDPVSRIKATATGQYPMAYILSCVDSRVPVEEVFDQGIGDVFVGRVAGNIESIDQLGSIEFATKLTGAKLVMVLGHNACGAVRGACDGAKLGNLTALLAEIEPAVKAVQGFEPDQRNSKDAKFVEAVVRKNVELTVVGIRKRSPVLAELEKSGAIKIVGALYSLEDGTVTLIDPK